MFKVYLKGNPFREACVVDMDTDVSPVVNHDDGCFYFQKDSDTLAIFPLENVEYIKKDSEAATRVGS